MPTIQIYSGLVSLKSITPSPPIFIVLFQAFISSELDDANYLLTRYSVSLIMFPFFNTIFSTTGFPKFKSIYYSPLLKHPSNSLHDFSMVQKPAHELACVTSHPYTQMNPMPEIRQSPICFSPYAPCCF